MKWNIALFLAGLSLFPASHGLAQQPGSVQYNTVTLPALMAAQRPGRLAPPADRWGAIAIGEGQTYGWMDKAGSEDEAKAAALTDCRAKGGGDCVVETVFANACAVLAAGSGGHTIASAPPAERTLDKTSKRALRRCGADCRIVREGCALPGG